MIKTTAADRADQEQTVCALTITAAKQQRDSRISTNNEHY